VTDSSYEEAENILEQTNYEVKAAIVMLKTNASYEETLLALQNHNRNVRETITYLLDNKV
ncbi:N-acetylmuramic acid 6-phosphate etherase, partial [Butyricicoccus sp. 1XD8-22]